MPIWFSKNGGNWNNDALADPATGSGGLSLHGVAGQTLYIICQGSDASITLNSGASVFSYSVPAGFSPWAGSVGGFTLSIDRDGLIYASSDDGYVCVIDLNGVEISRFKGNG